MIGTASAMQQTAFARTIALSRFSSNDDVVSRRTWTAGPMQRKLVMAQGADAFPMIEPSGRIDGDGW